MIARLKGTLEEKAKERVIVDVQGVGYSLLVPETVLRRLPDLGASVTLQVYTHVREDQISLFGFSNRLEKDVFEILLSASGVGPKLAISILSGLEAMQILEGVVQANKALFSGLSGVGKKTVEKLFVEIREKAEKRLLLERGEGEAPRGKSALFSVGSSSWSSDLEQALLALGYREADVRGVLREALKNPEIKNFDEALKYTLQFLSGGAKHKSLRGTA
jgi:Holliday junction DNA helicase RuvA